MLLTVRICLGLSRGWKPGFIQRSRLYPHLWIRLQHGAGYTLGTAYSSVCAIAWSDGKWFKGARSRLANKGAHRRIYPEQGEEDWEEE